MLHSLPSRSSSAACDAELKGPRAANCQRWPGAILDNEARSADTAERATGMFSSGNTLRPPLTLRDNRPAAPATIGLPTAATNDNHPSTRPPHLILIDARFASRLSRYTLPAHSQKDAGLRTTMKIRGSLRCEPWRARSTTLKPARAMSASSSAAVKNDT